MGNKGRSACRYPVGGDEIVIALKIATSATCWASVSGPSNFGFQISINFIMDPYNTSSLLVEGFKV